MNGFDMSKLLFSLLEPHCHRILLDHHSPSDKWTIHVICVYKGDFNTESWSIAFLNKRASFNPTSQSVKTWHLSCSLQLLAPFVLCLKSAVSSRCLISYQLIYTLHYMHAQSQAHAQFIRLNGILFIIHNIMLLLPACCNLQLKAYALLQPIQSRQKRPFIKS